MCSAVLEPAQEETKFEKDKKQAVFARVPGGYPESAPKNFFGEGVIQVFSIRYWCNDQEDFLCLVHNAFFAVALFG